MSAKGNYVTCLRCGKEFYWTPGHAYCSYECEKAVRDTANQRQEEHDTYIKQNTQCPVCRQTGITIRRENPDDHGFVINTHYTCNNCGREALDYKWKTLTETEKLTAENKELKAEVERLKEALEAICLVAVFPSPCPDYIEAVRGIAKEALDKAVYASINSDTEKGGEDE